jgi:hypothetical protein
MAARKRRPCASVYTAAGRLAPGSGREPSALARCSGRTGSCTTHIRCGPSATLWLHRPCEKKRRPPNRKAAKSAGGADVMEVPMLHSRLPQRSLLLLQLLMCIVCCSPASVGPVKEPLADAIRKALLPLFTNFSNASNGTETALPGSLLFIGHSFGYSLRAIIRYGMGLRVP